MLTKILKIKFILASLFFAAQTMAGPSPFPGGFPSSSPIVGEDLVCTGPGVMFAFDLERGLEKIWQSDPGKSEGLDLEVLDFRYARCPNCYSADVRLNFGGQNLDFTLDVRGGMMNSQGDQNITLDLIVDGQVEQQMPCERVN